MARGKYAVIAMTRREEELTAEVARLHSQLDAERARRHREVDELTRRVDSTRTEIGGEVAESVQNFLNDRLELMHAGLSTAVWTAQRLAMTQHLAWLFFRGFLDWDRLNGDVAVLTFISTHGDLEAWFNLTEAHGHRAARADRRKYARSMRQSKGRQELMYVAREVTQALDGDGDAATKAMSGRKGLDAVVEAARDAFVNVELSEVMTEDFGAAPPTEDQVQIHSLIMSEIDEFHRRAPGRK